MDIRIVISSGHDWGDRSGLGGQASNPDRGRFFYIRGSGGGGPLDGETAAPLLSVHTKDPLQFRTLAARFGRLAPIIRESAGSKLSEFA